MGILRIVMPFSENGHCSLNSCFELHNKHLLFSSVNFAISIVCFSPLIIRGSFAIVVWSALSTQSIIFEYSFQTNGCILVSLQISCCFSSLPLSTRISSSFTTRELLKHIFFVLPFLFVQYILDLWIVFGVLLQHLWHYMFEWYGQMLHRSHIEPSYQ